MPVYFVEARDSRFEELVRQLAAELRGVEQASGPAIRLEGIRKNHPYRVIVEWDAFKEISLEVRNEIIYEACREVFGNDAADHIEVIMGLTVEEARETGIDVRENA